MIRKKGRLFLWIGLLFSACAPHTRLIPAPVPSPPPASASSGAGDLAVLVRYVITPNGPGSWVRGASWDEYVLMITNLSATPISVEKICLFDQKGAALESASEIPKMPAGWFPKTDLALVAGGLGGVAALTDTALIAGPVGLLWTGLYMDAKYVANRSDGKEIRSEFQRRRLMPSTLQESISTTGSVFFPTTPSPKALVVDYRIGGEAKTVEVPLAGIRNAPTSTQPGKIPS